jgi:hypothetical protein
MQQLQASSTIKFRPSSDILTAQPARARSSLTAAWLLSTWLDEPLVRREKKARLAYINSPIANDSPRHICTIEPLLSIHGATRRAQSIRTFKVCNDLSTVQLLNAPAVQVVPTSIGSATGSDRSAINGRTDKRPGWQLRVKKEELLLLLSYYYRACNPGSRMEETHHYS